MSKNCCMCGNEISITNFIRINYINEKEYEWANDKFWYLCSWDCVKRLAENMSDHLANIDILKRDNLKDTL